MEGFEPTTLCSQSRCSSQTELHLENMAGSPGLEPGVGLSPRQSNNLVPCQLGDDPINVLRSAAKCKRTKRKSPSDPSRFAEALFRDSGCHLMQNNHLQRNLIRLLWIRVRVVLIDNNEHDFHVLLIVSVLNIPL